MSKAICSDFLCLSIKIPQPQVPQSTSKTTSKTCRSFFLENMMTEFSELQIRGGPEDNSKIIFRISQGKHTL